MDRLFLDANVLYSASDREHAGLRKLWALDAVELVTSEYAIEEARRNASGDDQLRRLDALLTGVTICAGAGPTRLLFTDVSLPDKDWPILWSAVDSGCTHLITGDRAHFGQYFGRDIAGVQILPPGEYLRARR